MEGHKRKSANRTAKVWLLAGAAGLLLAALLVWAMSRRTEEPAPVITHNNITTTIFWVGEDADDSNANIHNRSSTWTEDWVGAFGGVDNPKERCNMLPCGFKPKENPFYFALPYNDLDESCEAKPSQADAPWFRGSPPAGHSIIKNQWIKIRYGGKIAYAQWEDAGPFGENDSGYVFHGAEPQAQAGLDISPATAQYLGLGGRAKTSWEFVSEKDVPQGPWRRTITTSPPDCATQTADNYPMPTSRVRRSATGTA